MNLSNRWARVAAGAALVMVVTLGREARAERLWTERPAELRSSPGDDAQVVKRVAKGRSLEVVRRLGTWVQVEYEGRTGWIRRTALSTEPVSAGSADAGDKEDRKETTRKKGGDADEEAEGETSSKAAAAGAKKAAAKKKAERRKSRKARRAEPDDEEESDEEVASSGKKSKADEDDDGKPRRSRSSWAARGRLPGGPLKVEIQAKTASAFSEPDGSGAVVFTVTEGDQVRVIGRGENRWLLVENAKKRQGWIPAVAVRDHGLLPEARKDASKARDDEGGSEDEEASGAEEEEVEEKKSKKRTASSESESESDEIEEEDADEEESSDDSGSSKADDDTDVTLGSSPLEDDTSDERKPWSATANLLGGFTLVGLDRTPTGAGAQEASYSGPTAGLAGEFMYRLNPRLGIVANLDYDFDYPLGGLTYEADGAEQTDIKLQHHRIEASVGAFYGKRAMGIFRLGYSYSILQLSDINNPANLPRESTASPMAGVAFAYRFPTGLGARAGLDALLLGSRSQTDGQRDGAEFDSMLGLAGTAQVDYPLGKSLTLLGAYRFERTTASWTGASQRTPAAMGTDQTDQSHAISLGVGLRL